MLVCSLHTRGPPERGVPTRQASPSRSAHNICFSAQLAPWPGCPGTAGSNYGPSVGKEKGDLKGRFMSCPCRGLNQLWHERDLELVRAARNRLCAPPGPPGHLEHHHGLGGAVR